MNVDLLLFFRKLGKRKIHFFSLMFKIRSMMRLLVAYTNGNFAGSVNVIIIK